MSQVQYPNDRTDSSGFEWPTIGENIRNGDNFDNAIDNKLKEKEDIKNKVTDITENVTDYEYPSALAVKKYVENLISGGGEGGTNIIITNPPYFYAETADTIKKLSALRTEGTLFIVFITDSHIYTSSNNKQYFDEQMASIKAVCSAIKPDLVVHGGDMTNGSEAKSITIGYTDNVVKQIKEVGGNNSLILIGNHDGNCISESSSESERITESEMLSMYRSWDDGFTYPEGKLYGYRDYEELGLRVVRMNSYMGDNTYGGLGSNWGYTDDELYWFINTVLNTNYDIVILSHQTLSPILQGYQESQNIPYNGTKLQQAIDDWQNENRHCVGVICGHVHWDYTSKGKGDFTVIDHTTKEEVERTGHYGNFYEYANGLANYLTTASQTNVSPPVSSYRDAPKDAIVYGRKVHDTTEALWTAIIINTSNHKIDLIRFGAGNDISIDYSAETVVPVQSVSLNKESGELYVGETVDLVATILPENATNKSVTWESSDPQKASVNSGHVVAIEAGNVDITVKTIDGNKTDTYSLTIKAVERINALTLAVDSSGNPYNDGTGYKEGYRLNSLGVETAQIGAYATGFMPCTIGKTVEFSGFNTASNDTISGANFCYFCLYDSNKTLIKSNYTRDWFNMPANNGEESENYIKKITFNDGVGHADISDMAFIRVSGVSITEQPAIYIS